MRELAALLELAGENPFKIRAYERGARAIEELGDRFEKLAAENRLTEVEGIGEAIAQKAVEFVATGSFAALEKARAALPPGALELSRLPGLGPKRARQLYDALDIKSLEELRRAAAEGRIRGLKGFGEKMEQSLLAAIATHETRRTQLSLADALVEGEALLAHLRSSPAIERAELAGSLRRWKEVVGDLDVVVAASDWEAAADHFARYPPVAKVESRGSTKTTVRLSSGLQIDLRVVPAGDFVTAWHHFTGSKAHHARLRGLAKARGLTLSEWGLTRVEGGEKIPIASEAALYAALDLPQVPPELREDQGEFEAAAAGDRFEDLITLGDLRGLVHAHTLYSDGKATVEQMAATADALGMKYLTITDHSPTAHYANGVTVDRLHRQWDEIARVQERVKVRLLRGTESDILADGGLDYPDAILEKLDVVIASIHQRHSMDEDQMTARLTKAMRLPLFKIWGHALGRLLLEREPIAVRVDEVLEALSASRGAVEINGDPRRLDLPPQWARKARERGLKFVLSVDAHSTQAIGAHLPFAVAMARRAGIRKGDVLNALPFEKFRAAVRPSPLPGRG